MSSPQPGPERREITIRRAPKYAPFLALGALLGFLAALVVAYTGPAHPDYTREAALGLFTILFALIGVGLAALAVLLMDRISVRRSRRAVVEAEADDAADGSGPTAP